MSKQIYALPIVPAEAAPEADDGHNNITVENILTATEQADTNQATAAFIVDRQQRRANAYRSTRAMRILTPKPRIETRGDRSTAISPLEKLGFQWQRVKNPHVGQYSDRDGRYDRRPLALARNFSAWTSWEEMLGKTVGLPDGQNRVSFVNSILRPAIKEELNRVLPNYSDEALLDPHLSFKIHLELDVGYIVGWASSIGSADLSAQLKKLVGEEHADEWNGTVVKTPSNCCTAIFVADRRILAPKTSLVSCSIHMHPDERSPCWACMVYNIYPGPCLGDMVGDVTAKTGLLLFGKDHPGEQ